MRLPRWKADLIAAYTVHELLHALWTDWNAVAQSRADGLHGLTNALEDNRIEARATRGDLVQVSEARRLLEALNAHIIERALKAPSFRLDAPEQFSFVLNIVIFSRKAWLSLDVSRRLARACEPRSGFPCSIMRWRVSTRWARQATRWRSPMS